MSKKLVSFVLLISMAAFQNCSSTFESASYDSQRNANSLDPSLLINSDPVLQAQALSILNAKCASCHQDAISGGVTQILNVNHLVASGLIVPGNSSQGPIMTSIMSGSMPIGGTISATEIQTIRDWIASITVGGPLPVDPVASPLPAGKTVQVSAALHTQAESILNTNCAACHQGVTSGGVTNILDVNNLVRTGLIKVGDPTQGRLIGAIADGSMPDGQGARVTPADLLILKNWISTMMIVEDIGQAKPSTRPALSPTFAGVYANIIAPKCLPCHGPVLSRDKRYDMYASVKNDANKIVSEFQSLKMPENPYPKATPDELAALKAWVAAGALNN